MTADPAQHVDPRLLAAGHVRVHSDAGGALLTVVLDRPEARNAQTPATWRALAAVGATVAELDDADAPGRPRVVVLRGEGPSFSSGLDRAMLTPGGLDGEPSLAELAALDDEGLDAAIAGFQEAFTWWRRCSAVTVAAVQGHAVGAGFQLALACDLRLLADDAVLAMRETSLGLVPDLGGTRLLVEEVGESRALEICATGRAVSAAEAERHGLATAVVPAADLGATTDDLVAALLEPPAHAVREVTALLRGAARRTPTEQLAAERAAQTRMLREAARATRR